MKKLLILLLLPLSAFADVTITGTNSDPVHGVTIQEYRIEYGTQTGVYDQSPIFIPDLTIPTVVTIPDGSYYMTAIAVSTEGVESIPSDETLFTVLNGSVVKAPNVPDLIVR